MSLFFIRIVLLIAFTLCIKMIRKCKIASVGRVVGFVVLFPTALWLTDWRAQFALAGLASNAELLSAVYALGAVLGEVLTVLVCFILYKNITGENAGMVAVWKRQPKWIHAALFVIIILGGVLCYIQNISIAGVAMNMAQILKADGAGNVSMLGVISGFEALKIYTYARNAICGAVVALVAFGCVKKGLK